MFHDQCGGSGSSRFFSPERNAWRADTRHRTTIVCAGGAGTRKPHDGAFWIIREGHRTPSQGHDHFVRVAGVGPLKITRAPSRDSAAARAQIDGTLGFRARDGTTGTLHLRTDTVTLNQ